jgi:hypothetical protein
MKCKECRELFFSYQERSLTQPEMGEFEKHRRACPACAALFLDLERSAALFAEQSAPVPVPDWERSWQKIAAAVAPSASRPRQKMAWLSFPRWTLVAAGFLAFFILGVAAARLVFTPAKAPADLAGTSAFAYTARDYFSLLQPVMAEFGNALEPGGPAPVDPARLRGLLSDLYLLKQRAENDRDESLRRLLGDIELVLLEMAHLDRSRPENVRQLSELIQAKGIPMQIRVFKLKNRKITQI